MAIFIDKIRNCLKLILSIFDRNIVISSIFEEHYLIKFKS